jgi:hypothetical protein
MLESRRMSIIRLGYLVYSAGFFLHIVAFDGLTLFGIRLARQKTIAARSQLE